MNETTVLIYWAALWEMPMIDNIAQFYHMWVTWQLTCLVTH
jgi:hypothetical protein